MTLTDATALFVPCADDVLADESGAAAERAMEAVIANLNDDDADFVYDAWDDILEAIATA